MINYFFIITLFSVFNSWTINTSQSENCLLIKKSFEIKDVIYHNVSNQLYRFKDDSTSKFNIIIGIFYSSQIDNYDYIINYKLTDTASLSIYKNNMWTEFDADSNLFNIIIDLAEELPKGDYQQLKINSISQRTMIFFARKEREIIYKHVFEGGSDFECLINENEIFKKASIIFSELHKYAKIPVPE